VGRRDLDRIDDRCRRIGEEAHAFQKCQRSDGRSLRGLFEQPPPSARAFCRDRKLNLHTFYGWHRQRVIRRLVERYAGSGRDERAAEYPALLSVEAAAS